MVNVYDAAYALASAIENSEEYKRLIEAKKKIEANPKNKEMLQDFYQKQLNYQTKQMMGEKVEEELKQLQNLYSVLSMNMDLNEYLQAEYAFSTLIADMYKIIGDVLEKVRL